MNARAIRAFVVAASVLAVGTLSLTRVSAADPATPAPPPADPMGACCGTQPTATDTSATAAPPMRRECGPGTHLVVGEKEDTCVNDNLKK